MLVWVALGVLFAAGISGRVAAMGPGTQARLILGDYVDDLKLDA